MDRLLYLAMNGAKSMFDRQAQVAHNLANVSTAGFRAETISLAPGGLTGRFNFSEELGAARQLHCLVAGESVIAQVTGHAAFEMGEPVSLHVQPAALQLFDAQTGRRLPQRPAAAQPSSERRPMPVSA